MFHDGMRLFARTFGGSCALLAGLAVCGMATSPAQASTAQASTLASIQLISGTPVKAVKEMFHRCVKVWKDEGLL